MGPNDQPRSGSDLAQLLGLLTLLVFGGVGVLLMRHVQDRDVIMAVLGDTSIFTHLVVGTASGAIIGFGAWGIVRAPFMRPVLARYVGLIGPLMRRRSDRLLIAFCAGVGEELFFRGALQFWLGIPITAVLFVALHGYLDPRNWRISIYGALMSLAIMGLGWLAEAYGLLAPMLAHVIIDVVLLEKLQAHRPAAAITDPVGGVAQEDG